MTEQTEIHQGVFVAVLGYGVLITGKAASGKSSFALELLNQGYKLIADDIVEFQLDEGNNVVGRCPQMLTGMLQHRELGIIMVKQVFGEQTNPEQHCLDYIVQLSDEHQEQISLNPPQKNQVIIVDSKKNIVSGWMNKEKIAKLIRKQIEVKIK